MKALVQQGGWELKKQLFVGLPFHYLMEALPVQGSSVVRWAGSWTFQGSCVVWGLGVTVVLYGSWSQSLQCTGAFNWLGPALQTTFWSSQLPNCAVGPTVSEVGFGVMGE